MEPQYTVTTSAPSELSAAFLQTGVLVGLALVCVFLYRRFRKPYFRAWAAAWGLYAIRLGSIAVFLLSGTAIWLYWHQVLTGWTALALLWAALAFSQRLDWRHRYWLLVLFPPAWSYVAIYRLDNFLLAAGPAVLFLSLATVWTGFVFFRHHRSSGSRPAALMAGAFFLWGLHHLDYPFLRARGAWNPWGYYLDIFFLLLIGLGILLLVLDDQQRGLGVLSALSGDLQRGGGEQELIEGLLARPLTLPAVTGSAIFFRSVDGGRFANAAGSCADWIGSRPIGPAREAIDRVVRGGHPVVVRDDPEREGDTAPRHAYTAALPVLRGESVVGALVVVGRARDPFTVLNEEFLIALGRQVGAALVNAHLYQSLSERSRELERLTAQMVRQQEAERKRLSRELHDETAQLFAAVRLQLGVAMDEADPPRQASLERAVELVDSGIRSIRSVARNLRPTLLDDLGLLPALKAQALEFEERTGIATRFTAPDAVPALSADAELALFRAVQEGLANVARHAGADSVKVALEATAAEIRLQLEDDGEGIPGEDDGGPRFGTGLAGMRERIGALGGTVRLEAAERGGARLEIHVPVPDTVSA